MVEANELSEAALAKIRRRMVKIDGMPEPIRLLIHEYGYAAVSVFLELGVKAPKHIEELIQQVRFGRSSGSFEKVLK